MKNCPATAIEFLEQVHPNGPWVLTAIDPDKKGIQTKPFLPDDKVSLTAWLNSCHERKQNVYYSVNQPILLKDKKASRQEIHQVCYFHVDLDPREGKDVDDERARILHTLSDGLPTGVPAPSCIVSSGGGYNALWKLDYPIEVNGDLERAEDVKRYNQQLELLFEADHCHNIDRILRLPGTVNIPDAKKRRKGRVEALAQVIALPGTAYAVSEFSQVAPVQTAAPVGTGRVKPPKFVTRITVDELPDNVPDKCKIVIVQGRDPDEPQKFESRSEWLFYVVCSLVRSDVPDDVIFSVITDPDMGISESVLDKGSSSTTYALRQIEQAHEHAIDPKLRDLNAKYAVIGNIGGKCRIIEEIMDQGLGRSQLTKKSFADFRNEWMHHKIKVGENDKGKPIYKPLGNWWLEQPKRRQYGVIAFVPEGDPGDAYNLWRGFACDAIPGDCSLFLKHLKENVCRGNEEHYDYLMNWMARCVQHPASPGETAIVMRGKQGTGKSFSAQAFGSLWGRHFIEVADSKHLVGSFNAHLRDCVVLFGDEAFFAGDVKHESKLKTLITGKQIQIEAKGVDAETAPNYVHLMMASNSDWVVPAGPDERRYFVLDVSDNRMQDSKYFKDIQDQLDNGGREALLHQLMNRDLSQFNVHNVPKTDALRDQKQLSFSSEEEWWFTKLYDGILLPGHSGWELPVMKEKLLTDYLTYSQRVGISRRSSSTILWKFLKKATPPSFPRSKQRRTKMTSDDGAEYMTRAWFCEFGSLKDCRQWFDENFGGPYEWPEEEPDNLDEGEPF